MFLSSQLHPTGLVIIKNVNENWCPVPKKPTILGKAYNTTGNKTMS